MKKILVIEDNNEIRENIAEILQLDGYETIEAANGVEGVTKAQQEMPDLIICDIMMPELDGYGVLHILGKKETTAGIPFIFLTAKVERADMRKGMNLGADDYLTKPFDDTELLDAIEMRLKKADALKKDYHDNAEGLNQFILGRKKFAWPRAPSFRQETEGPTKANVKFIGKASMPVACISWFLAR